MKHKELKSLDKHLTRTMWGLCIAYWILIFHPVPDILKLATLGVWGIAVCLSVGVLIADRIIYKNRLRETK